MMTMAVCYMVYMILSLNLLSLMTGCHLEKDSYRVDGLSDL